MKLFNIKVARVYAMIGEAEASSIRTEFEHLVVLALEEDDNKTL